MSHYRLPLGDGRVAHAARSGAGYALIVGGKPQALLTTVTSDTQQVILRGPAPGADALALIPVLAELFCRQPELRTVALELDCDHTYAAAATRAGVATQASAIDSRWRLQVERGSFWQHPALWLTAPNSAGMALRYTMTGEKRHPLRAPQARGTVYRRYLPELDTTLSFRVADLERDLDTFHAWMNQDRVHRFWELAGDRESHARYLQGQLDDPKGLPLIAEFDDEPFAYLETYWAKEDRLAPFYDVRDFDRGCHVLVGNSRHRGPAKVTAWMRAMCHYLFLDDPRTQRIVGEPRVDNARFIDYLQAQGFAKLKEFNFPHKRAAMVVLEREAFFDQYGPWGEA
jgi:acetyl CoA:N6-hydroxylysine acetyl transferase